MSNEVLPWSFSNERPPPGTAEPKEDAPPLFKPIVLSNTWLKAHSYDKSTDKVTALTNEQAGHEWSDEPKEQTKDEPLNPPMTGKVITAKNRIAVSPMCMYSAKDGMVNDFHVGHYGELAIGGAGLIVVEATGVQANGRITPGCLGLWNDQQIEGHARLVHLMHSQKTVAGLQLAHAGRKSSTPPPFVDLRTKTRAEADEGGWPNDVVGPSAIPWGENWYVPRELTLDEIEVMKEDWVKAAHRAEKAGYDYLEIHAAHGYLLHEFYSAFSNHRTDKYGGSFANRTRLLIEIATQVRAAWPAHKPLAVRLSCTDWIPEEEGWDLNQTIKLVDSLIRVGVDVIDTSSGGNARHQRFGIFGNDSKNAKNALEAQFGDPTAQNVIKKDYQTQFGARLKDLYGDQVVIGPVGFITDGASANHLVETNQADFVHIGRQFLRDPHFVSHAGQDLEVPHVWMAPQYEWAVGASSKTKRQR